VAEALAPTSPDGHYLLGRLYMQKGENEKAMPYLRKAAELGHPDAEAVIGECDK
jgi:TPR repeat protein